MAILRLTWNWKWHLSGELSEHWFNSPGLNHFTRKNIVLVGVLFSSFSWTTVKWLHHVVEICILSIENQQQQYKAPAQSMLLIDKQILVFSIANLYFLYWVFYNQNIQFFTLLIFNHHSNFLRLTNSLEHQSKWKAKACMYYLMRPYLKNLKM